MPCNWGDLASPCALCRCGQDLARVVPHLAGPYTARRCVRPENKQLVIVETKKMVLCGSALSVAALWVAALATMPPEQVVLCSCDPSSASAQAWVWGSAALQAPHDKDTPNWTAGRIPRQPKSSSPPLTPAGGMPLRLAADKTRCVFTAGQLGLTGKGERSPSVHFQRCDD